jgi:hypothetical protein
MKELFGENGLFKNQDPSAFNNCQDMLDLLEKNDYANQLLEENEIEPLEHLQVLQCYQVLNLLQPNLILNNSRFKQLEMNMM